MGARAWVGWATAALAACFVAACGSAQSEPSGETADAAPARVLVFSHTTGFRHGSIGPGVAAVNELAGELGLEADTSEDTALFTEAGLAPYVAIVFLSTSTNPIAPESEWLAGDKATAVQGFVRSGGGGMGVHAAADSHYRWAWYGDLMGAYFRSHLPGTQVATVTATNTDHPAAPQTPPTFVLDEEWYWFRDVRPDIVVLQSVPASATGDEGEDPRPITWAQEFDGGRSFYTGFGHPNAAFADPNVRATLKAGLAWTAGVHAQ